MGKKKAIKLATATAIAASAFVAVAPTQSEAATSSVDKAITKASSAMVKAFNTYNKTAREDHKLPALSTIKKDVKAAQDAYKAATKEIAKNGGSKSAKAKLTAKLDTNKKYLDRAELYLKAVTTNLNPAKTAFTDAVASGKQSKVKSTQIAYQAKISEFEANVKKVYGPDARNLLTAKYADAANKLVNSVNDEMTVYKAYSKISGLVGEDLEAAYNGMEDVKEETANVAKLDSKLAKNITSAVDSIKAKFEKAVQATVSIEGITAGETTEEETKTITIKAIKGSENKVTLNGTAVAANENGSYTLKLQEGSNKVAVESTVYGVKTELSIEITSNQTPAVKSVSANNLKTVTLTFNKAINKDTVDVDGTSNDTVKVYRNGASTISTLADSQLSEDGKTLVLEFASLNQSDSLKFVVDGLKTTDGKAVKKFEDTKTVVDTTLPTIDAVSVLNSKALEVKVSEPLKELAVGGFSSRSEVKVDGISLPVKVTNDALNGSIVLDFGSKIEVGEHKLTLSGLVDYAGFKAADKEFTFSVKEDTTAPEIVSAEALDKNTVEINFSESVDVLGSIDVNGNTSFDSTTWSADKKKLTLVKNAGLFNLGSTVESKIKYRGTKDVEGNEVTTEKTFSFKAADDTTKPSVSSVEVKDGNAVEVTFSEALSTRGTVTVKNSTGTVVASKVAVPALDSKNKATFTGSQLGLSANGGTYTLEFEGQIDNSVRQNAGEKYTTTITAKDIQKATASLIYKEAGKLTVQFDEAMDATTLGNKANYIVNVSGTEQYLSAVANSEISVAADNKSVVLTIPGSTSGTKVRVQGVKDEAGNIISNFNSELTATDVSGYTFNHSDISTVKAVAKNKVEVELTGGKTFASIDPSTFVLYAGTASGSATKLVATKAELNAAKTKATLTLNANLDGTARLDGAVYLGTQASNTITKDQYGKALTIAAANRIAVTDAIAPSLTKVEKVADTKNQFKLVFSEAVTENNRGDVKKDLIIKKADGTILADSDYTVSNVAGTKSTDLVITVTGGVTDGVESFTVSMPNSRTLHDGTVGGLTSTGNLADTFTATTVSNVEIELDDDAPDAPTVTSPRSATTVNAATFNITGSAEAGSTITVYNDVNNDGSINAGDTVVGTGTATAGTFSVATPLVEDAANNFVVTATDEAGNESTPQDVATITEDSINPAAPSFSELTITATAVTAATSTAEAGATINVVADGAESTSTAVSTATVGTGGSINLTGLTTATAYDIYVVDAAGNVSTKVDITTS